MISAFSAPSSDSICEMLGSASPRADALGWSESGEISRCGVLLRHLPDWLGDVSGALGLGSTWSTFALGCLIEVVRGLAFGVVAHRLAEGFPCGTNSARGTVRGGHLGGAGGAHFTLSEAQLVQDIKKILSKKLNVQNALKP